MKETKYTHTRDEYRGVTNTTATIRSSTVTGCHAGIRDYFRDYPIGGYLTELSKKPHIDGAKIVAILTRLSSCD